MTQKIVNGFPQFYSFTYLVSNFFGSAMTQLNQDHTDIDLQNPPGDGDPMTVTRADVDLLSVSRDGAVLYVDRGYQIIAPNVLRISPGLLDGETIQCKKFIGAFGVLKSIPELGGSTQGIGEATIFTDNSTQPVNAFSPVIVDNKTRFSTHFTVDEGKLDVFINGSRVSINDGIWRIVDSKTIELNDDYSSVRMKIDIVRQKIG